MFKCFLYVLENPITFPVVQVPFFGNFDLITYASLNGGAVFGEYVRMLREWTIKFAPDVTEEQIYAHIVDGESSARKSQQGEMLVTCLAIFQSHSCWFALWQ